uniref:Isopenicillin N synthase-like Fe(2+) 2OG dioxygenase domain-containing protein n=1 Tax=Oryza brachyantha TaxID=4533 RepID=J3KU18_ORYBR
MSDEQKLDWADLLGIFSQPPQGRDMRYWPTETQTFRSSLECYSFELMKVAHSVVASIAKTLNIEIEMMADKYPVQFLRMNYYPPCTSMPEKVLGFSPHSDASFLTLLLEVNSVQGLQIRKGGAWIPVKPCADALLVNVREFLEVSNSNRAYLFF